MKSISPAANAEEALDHLHVRLALGKSVAVTHHQVKGEVGRLGECLDVLAAVVSTRRRCARPTTQLDQGSAGCRPACARKLQRAAFGAFEQIRSGSRCVRRPEKCPQAARRTADRRWRGKARAPTSWGCRTCPTMTSVARSASTGMVSDERAVEVATEALWAVPASRRRAFLGPERFGLFGEWQQSIPWRNDKAAMRAARKRFGVNRGNH